MMNGFFDTTNPSQSQAPVQGQGMNVSFATSTVPNNGMQKNSTTPKTVISAEQLEALKNQLEPKFIANALLGLKSVNQKKLADINIEFCYDWEYNAQTGFTSFNIYFSDTMSPSVEVERSVIDKSAEAETFERYATIGFIRPDGTWFGYTYKGVLETRVQKAIARVLYERFLEDKVDIPLKRRMPKAA